MTDPVNVQFDGAEFTRGADKMVSALQEIRAALVALSNTPTNKLQADVAKISTSFVNLTDSMQKLFRNTAKGIDSAMKEAEAKGRVQGAAVAKAVQAGLDQNKPKIVVDGPDTGLVKAQIKALQAQYETALSKGWNIKIPALQELRAQGVQLAPADRLRLVDDANLTKSALGLDPRTLLGLPKRDEMRAFGSALVAQLREGVMTDAARAASASNIDPRTLLGLPSRDGMKSFGSSLAAQLRDGVKAENLRAASASNIDPRTLLGLPDRNSMKSLGSALAAQMRDGIRVENLRASSAGSVDPRTLLGLPSRDSMKAMGASIAAQIREGVKIENLRAASASNIDPRTLLGLGQVKSAKQSMSVFLEADRASAEAAKSLGALDVAQGRAASSGKGLTTSTKLVTNALNDAHSAARGVASGFGAMWLTWGNVAPLLAGAAVSNAFVQSIRQGAAVQDTLTRIRVLGGESEEAVRGLNSQMLDLARNGPFGPLEIAEAMKTLTLAGLGAAEVSSSVKEVLNFSLAGDTTVKQAADTLTTVATAFGVGAESYSYVSNLISKAAAESKASVESISEAFKTASVVNEQYGVSLEDVSTGLALLANVGIQGTAAGTALRNVYVDLAGRTKEVDKVLRDLGVRTIDPLTGKMRAQADVFKDLLGSLAQNRNPEAATKAINEIFSERSGKLAIAILDALKRKAKETSSEVGNAYDELAAKIADNAGFTARAAAELSLTPLRQMQSVGSSLQAALVETFNSMQPYVLEISQQLRGIFQSESFRKAITEITVAIGRLTVFLLENGRVAASLVLAYAGFRSVLSVLASVNAAVLGLSAATQAATAAGVAMTGVMRAAALANPALAGLSAVVAIGATAWAAYQLWANRSAGAVEVNTLVNTKALIERLEQERDRLREVNQARREGITIQEVQRRKAASQALANNSDELTRAEAAVTAAEENLKPKKGKTPPSLTWYATAKRELQDAKDKVALVKSERARLEKVRKDLEAEVAEEDASIIAAEKKRQAETAAELAKMFKGGPNPPTAQERSDALRASELEFRNELKKTDQALSASSTSLAKWGKLSTYQMEVAKQNRDLGLLSSREYADRLEKADEEAFLRQVEHARRSRELAEESSRKLSEIQNRPKTGITALGGNAEQATQAVEQLRQQAQKAEDDVADAARARALRQGQAVVDALRPAQEATKDASSALTKLNLDTTQHLEKLAASNREAFMSERDLFIMQESMRMVNAYEDALSKLQETFNKGLSEGAFDDLSNPGVRAEFERMVSLIDQFKNKIAEVRGPATAGRLGGLFDAGRDIRMAKDLGTAFSGAFEKAVLGGNKLRDVMKGLASDIMAIVTRRMVSEPLGNAISGMFMGGGASSMGSGLLGGVFKWLGLGGASSSASSGFQLNPVEFLYGMHSGGIVGSEATFGRGVNPAVFAGASRFHSGGLVGGEIPIIAQRGEGVFTPAQMRALAPAGGERTVQITQHFTVGNNTDKRTQQQIGAAALSGAQRALSRNG